MAGYKRKHTKRPLAKRAAKKLTTRAKAVKAAKKTPTPKRKIGRPSKAKPAVHLEVLRAVPEQAQSKNKNSEVSSLINEYQKKRNFLKTPEPEGGNYRANLRPIFVIQKHNASKLHYDFRIEVNGVLKSWAVPKGVSSDLHDKRLAVATEDHPLEYANFKGTIPEGEYGAGTVIIWDRGYYENITHDHDYQQPKAVEQSLKEGHLQIRLQGKKVKGDYLLQRFNKGKKENWLLIKIK